MKTRMLFFHMKDFAINKIKEIPYLCVVCCSSPTQSFTMSSNITVNEPNLWIACAISYVFVMHYVNMFNLQPIQETELGYYDIDDLKQRFKSLVVYRAMPTKWSLDFLLKLLYWVWATITAIMACVFVGNPNGSASSLDISRMKLCVTIFVIAYVVQSYMGWSKWAYGSGKSFNKEREEMIAENQPKRRRSSNKNQEQMNMSVEILGYSDLTIEQFNARNASMNRGFMIMVVILFFILLVAFTVTVDLHQYATVGLASTYFAWNSMNISAAVFTWFYTLCAYIVYRNTNYVSVTDNYLDHMATYRVLNKDGSHRRFEPYPIRAYFVMLPVMAILAFNFIVASSILDFFNSYSQAMLAITVILLYPMIGVAFMGTYAAWFEHFVNGLVYFFQLYFMFPSTFLLGAASFSPADVNTNGTRHLMLPSDFNNTALMYRSDPNTDNHFMITVRYALPILALLYVTGGFLQEFIYRTCLVGSQHFPGQEELQEKLYHF
jgi:hypothetical protein